MVNVKSEGQLHRLIVERGARHESAGWMRALLPVDVVGASRLGITFWTPAEPAKFSKQAAL
jgi:hypothetical protein